MHIAEGVPPPKSKRKIDDLDEGVLDPSGAFS